MNLDLTINEIESDIKALSELNKLLIDSTIENNKAVDELVVKVVEENYVISNSIEKINKSIEKIGQIAECIGNAYENYTMGGVEKILKESL